MRRFALALVAIITWLWLPSADAADTRSPSAAEIVRKLSSPPVMGLTRSFPVGDRGVAVEAATTTVAHPSVDLEVNFAFNSAGLTTDTMLTLDQLGVALNDPALADGHFQIAGHTDGKGTDSYNQKLSEARAAAVTAYMVNKYHVSDRNLESVGFGKRRLRDPDHPDAAINRRVQVTRLDE